MTRIIFNIEPTAKTMTQLIKGVKREGSRIWAGRVLTRAALISQEIGTMLVKIFNNTVVAKALRGQGSEDLPAHFGLDDSTANALADGMAELIRSSVHILSRSQGDTVSIRIQAVEKNWGEYLSLPGAQYISSPSNITIPVVKWLLMDPNIDIGAAAYQIIFSGDSEQFNTRIQKVSRSGRAIMVSLEALGGGGTPYVLPSIVSGGMGENFIEMALGQKGVSQKAALILVKRVI
jgi:hypothetical protein